MKERMATATATAHPSQAPAKKARTAIPSSICVLLFIVVAALNNPAPVQADTELSEIVALNTQPSKIVFYLFANFSIADRYNTVVPGYGGTPTTPGFGAISVFEYGLRLTEDIEAPTAGEFTGYLVRLRDNGIYLECAIVLSTPSYNGTLALQYRAGFLVNGEGAITGGTGDFRYARGYVDFYFISVDNPEAVVFSGTIHLKYD